MLQYVRVLQSWKELHHHIVSVGPSHSGLFKPPYSYYRSDCYGTVFIFFRFSVENAYLEEKEDTCNALGEIAENLGYVCREMHLLCMPANKFNLSIGLTFYLIWMIASEK